MLTRNTLLAILALACLLVTGTHSALASDGKSAEAAEPGAKACCAAERSATCAACQQQGNACCQPSSVRLGAVAYSPSTVTVFESLRRYLAKQDFPVDYVLYSNYDALVGALAAGDVDIAWNTPLAHAKYHTQNKDSSQTLVMRDVDCNFRSVLVARKDSGIKSLKDLKDASLVLGSNQAAEATVLPIHYLKRQGVDFDALQIVSLDGEEDLHGNPCSSEHHVLKALKASRGQAGVIGERLWQRLAEKHGDHLPLVKIWTSPAFSHCVFTASEQFDQAKADRFTKLMLAMDPQDPLAADVMRLEGTKQWVAGSPDGFHDLIEAISRD